MLQHLSEVVDFFTDNTQLIVKLLRKLKFTVDCSTLSDSFLAKLLAIIRGRSVIKHGQDEMLDNLSCKFWRHFVNR